MKKFKIIILLFIITSLTSCIGDVDFNQVNDLDFNTQYNLSLVYFKLEQNDFINQDTNSQTPLRVDFTNIDVFNNSSVTGKLEKAILKFEIDNTFNKEFELYFILKDSDNNTLITIPFEVNQNETQSLNIEYLKGTDNFDNLIKTKQITIIGNMLPNSNLTTEQMYIHFKSAVDLYLKISDV